MLYLFVIFIYLYSFNMFQRMQGNSFPGSGAKWLGISEGDHQQDPNHEAMDWFKGKSMGKPKIFPLNMGLYGVFL